MSRKTTTLAAFAVVLLLPSAFLLASAHKYKKQKPPAPIHTMEDERQRAMHALNRLTFGPRPGEVDRVLAVGVDKWIAQQLAPEKIDDSALETRLAPYRTLRMSPSEMVENFPPEQILRAITEGKMPMPAAAGRDPQLKAVYTAGLARFNEKQVKKNAKAVENAELLETSPDELSPEMKEKRQNAREHARSRALDLMELPPGARTQSLAAMDVDERRGFWRALSQDDRDKLTADMTPQQKELLLSLENPVVVVNSELMQSKLLRAAYSERQLQEVMTDFWFNHFNVFLGKGAERYLVTAYERDVIRPRALGKFSDLLLATAKSPAMLWYLDNWQSVGPNSQAAGRGKNNGKPSQGLNENYAREVMELHTLGVNGGYTQKDVTELARVLTGWTLEEPRQGGGFIFREPRHEPGDKIVLGRTFHEDGQREGEAALEMLAHQPATAHFISIKLAQRFVNDTPPTALVDAMAKTFLESDGDIKAVLRTMLRAPEFWDENEYRAKVKTPLEFTVSAIRGTGAEITRTQSVVDTLNRMGMPLYGAQPPTGYSMQAESWVNSGALLNRMNFALGLGTGKLAGVRVDIAKLAGNGTNADEVQRTLEQALLAGSVSAQTHETIAKQLNDPLFTGRKLDDPPKPVNPGAVAGLILGSPEFQRR
ncbi:MAG TPA: DUF1800 domain-containing protein [Candidatus Saccharimonadales bacterium]|nr:DUF1800 domain-containing protein [Candidatus Saccharimonadales bacterium]